MAAFTRPRGFFGSERSILTRKAKELRGFLFFFEVMYPIVTPEVRWTVSTVFLFKPPSDVIFFMVKGLD